MQESANNNIDASIVIRMLLPSVITYPDDAIVVCGNFLESLKVDVIVEIVLA